jgi:transglutaminase-like putative cysteine protease
MNLNYEPRDAASAASVVPTELLSPSQAYAQRHPIQIRVGFEMEYYCPAPTPMILVLSVHHSRTADLLVPDLLVTNPPVPIATYHDLFGNWCSRSLLLLGGSH